MVNQEVERRKKEELRRAKEALDTASEASLTADDIEESKSKSKSKSKSHDSATTGNTSNAINRVESATFSINVENSSPVMQSFHS